MKTSSLKVSELTRKLVILILVGLFIGISGCSGGSPVIPDDSNNPRDINAQDFLSNASNPTELGQGVRSLFLSAGLADMFGQSVMDAYLAEIDDMLSLGLNRETASAQSLLLRELASGQCETSGASFELDGVKYDGSFTICPTDTEDKKTLEFSFSTGLEGKSVEKAGKSVFFSLTIQASTDKCPSVEGEVSGESLVNLTFDVTDSTTSAHFSADSQFNIDATINDDAEVESVDTNLNISADGFDSEYPQTGYNGVSSVNTNDFDFLKDSFKNALIDGLVPQGPCPNPKGIGMTLGICVAASKATAEEAREYWRDDGNCIEIQMDPEELKIASGEKKSFDVEVIRIKDSEKVSAKLEATADSGEITPESGQYEQGSPVTFEYTAPTDGEAGEYSIKATSKCGIDTLSKTIMWDWTVVMDSTLTFREGELEMSGHVRVEIPIVWNEQYSRQMGTGPGEYIDFTFILPDECTFETVLKQCSDINVINFEYDGENMSALRVTMTPFTTSEGLLAHCPDGSGSGPPINSVFSTNFFAVHQTEFQAVEGGMAFVFTDWTVNSEEGIPLKKTYDRVVNINAAAITEYTVFELRTTVQ